MVITNNGKVLINNREIIAIPEDKPQLYKPSVYVRGDPNGATLNIENNNQNGKFPIRYCLVVGDSNMELVNNNDTIVYGDSSVFVDLNRIFTEPKTYNLAAKVTSNGFIDSPQTETFSFKRYEDNTYSTVIINQNEAAVTVYVKSGNDYNISEAEYSNDYSTTFCAHKMTFYFSHPNLISVNNATITYQDANGEEVVEIVQVFVENGRTNTINFNAVNFPNSPQTFTFNFEFVLSGSGV